MNQKIESEKPKTKEALIYEAREEYEKIQQSALKEYEKIQQSARIEYEKIKQPALKKLERIRQQALKEYEKIQQSALKEYEKIQQPALKEYEKIQQPALEEYWRKRREIEASFEKPQLLPDGGDKEPKTRLLCDNREEYNGWANRETWAVKLHWDNNQGDYTFFSENAREFKKQGKSAYDFADFLKETYEDMYYNLVNRPHEGTEEAWLMLQDVGSHWRVDWVEIAEAYYSEVDE